MNKVYLWYPRVGNIGHASLDISLNQGYPKAQYVSWWPMANSLKIKAGFNVTAGTEGFIADCQSEGSEANPRLPDHTVDFGGLDEDRMRARWSEIYKRANYEFFYANCATTVADILRAGGADLSARVRWHMDQVTVWSPWEVFRIAQVILTYSATIERLRAQGWKREELDSTTAWSEWAGQQKGHY